MSEEKKALKKRSIPSITVTITVKADLINENGNLCGWDKASAKVVKVEGAPKGTNAEIKPLPTGAIFIGLDKADGLSYLTSAEAEKAKPKFF